MSFLRRFVFALAHVAVAYGALFLGFWSAKHFEIAALPALVVSFVSFPVVVIGAMNFYFGSYDEIPGVVWVMSAMLLAAGVMLGVSMLFM